MSVSSSQEGLGFAARVLPYTIPGLEELDPFNMLAGIRGLFDFSYSYPRGLILHTGCGWLRQDHPHCIGTRLSGGTDERRRLYPRGPHRVCLPEQEDSVSPV